MGGRQRDGCKQREGRKRGERQEGKEKTRERRKAGVKKYITKQERHREDILRTVEESSHTSCTRKNDPLRMSNTHICSLLNIYLYNTCIIFITLTDWIFFTRYMLSFCSHSLCVKICEKDI